MAEAEIVEWKVRAGETVSVDQVLLSVETAKALVDVPSPVAGVIARLCGQEGTYSTSEPLVEFEGGEDDGTVVGKVSAHQQHIEDHFVVGAMAPGGTLVQAMPAVRLLAQKLGLDIDRIQGSGSAGMVTEQDVQSAFEAMQGSGNEFLKGVAAGHGQGNGALPQDCGAGQHHGRGGLAPLAVRRRRDGTPHQGDRRRLPGRALHECLV